LGFVKELNIYIVEEDLPKVIDILRKHDVAGMAFGEIQGAGHMKRREIRERSGWEVKTVTPEYEKRTKVDTIVSDSSVERIVGDLMGGMGSKDEPRGMIFVKDVANAYEIGTKLSGDTLLTHAGITGKPVT
jgi:nitrogen regulatory protein P-II 1